MKRSIERIVQQPLRPGMVGDGFRVFNYIPGANIAQQRISPFLMLDFNAEYDFGPSEHIRGVDVHPHKGFETVTIAYKGSVAHHDSSGNSGVIHAGDVQWMTAGKGILHKEYHEETFSRSGGPFEMVQLWINLPKKDKGADPHYQAITAADMGQHLLPQGAGQVRVIAGDFEGTAGPAQTYTPVNLFNIWLSVGKDMTFRLPEAHHAALLVVNGATHVNGELAGEHDFVLFGAQGEEITLHALQDSLILVLSGEPINEPIASYGPFVMNTQAEIREAIMDYNLGKFGVLD
ncbi:short-chain dehydrogenase [Pedobacter yulinensis]|uniref:Short-chain dehydrogenase n=1 Tax=Pedobacter yulinensis TaxID=2126353 RepID=A0A2T3HPG5_9SPHI|nr:pirin family protein [Pedobacter yulinensis]PST84345.1 short-chain dehydrogenase [Pedobacter yulinensis]